MSQRDGVSGNSVIARTVPEPRSAGSAGPARVKPPPIGARIARPAWLTRFMATAAALAMIAGAAASPHVPATAQATLSVHIRRDLRNGFPFEHAHSAGVGSIVWGSASPGAAVTLALERAGGEVVTRRAKATVDGVFRVSMDRRIAAGDTLRVIDGSATVVVPIPPLSAVADPDARRVTGTGPPDVLATQPGAPHSLEVAFGRVTRQVTTDAAGAFTADFATEPFMPAALGTLHYVNSDSMHVYQPLFAVDPFARGESGDGWADVILGQPDFGQTTFNAVGRGKLFNPNGVLVDRTRRPNRVWVYDGGNSRVLGWDHLGVCDGGGERACTTDSDCGAGRVCAIDVDRPADVVLGQPGFGTSRCNGDGAFQDYPDVPQAGPDTLCLLREEQMSLSEGGSGATMAVDAAGRLYVPDFFNNRVLAYDDPFTHDAVADHVWGQADFLGVTCNGGWGYGRATADRLCLASPPGYGNIKSGVAIDSTGALWVADNENNRVVRFPFDPGSGHPADTADLVLGQMAFTFTSPGDDMGRMRHPMSVRVADNGTVLVADTDNNRVLEFRPPLTSGMPASGLFGRGWRAPVGLEIGSDGAVWVNETDGGRIAKLEGGIERASVPIGSGSWGGIGVDADGNTYTAGWSLQVVERVRAPDYRRRDNLLAAGQELGIFNLTGNRGLYGGKGIEVTPEQLIYADGARILFWNRDGPLATYRPADGVVGQPDFATRPRWATWFERMRADGLGRLWVLRGAFDPSEVWAYDLPLETGAQPVQRLTQPLPLAGGGSLAWGNSVYLGGIAYDAACDCLWLADEDNHRVFRVRDARTRPTVDVVLGQRDAAGAACNQGRGREAPSADALCHPGGLSFDPRGNLWVADHNTEFDGNLRLLMFTPDSLPRRPAAAVFGVAAARVLGRGGDFTAPDCPPREVDPLCAPWEASFDKRGNMALGFNGYLGPRFLMLYRDPRASELPFRALGDFQSMPTSYRFDEQGDLYVLEHNRSRILVYRDPAGERVPASATPSASPTATAFLTATATSTATATPFLTATAHTTADPRPWRIHLPALLATGHRGDFAGTLGE